MGDPPRGLGSWNWRGIWGLCQHKGFYNINHFEFNIFAKKSFLVNPIDKKIKEGDITNIPQ